MRSTHSEATDGDALLAPPPRAPITPGDRPTFSVIVACYNSAATVGESIASALEQVPAPFEVIVCDDGSTDDLASALAPFGDAVRVLRQPNGGEGAAKAAAAAAATGDFVVILDADDVYLPGRLRALGDAIASRPDLDIVTTDAWLEIDGEKQGRYYRVAVNFPVLEQRDAILQGNFVFGLAAVRRSRLEAVGGFDRRQRTVADWDCWIRLILTGSSIGLVDRPLAIYRQHAGGLSAQRATYRRGRAAVLAKVLSNPNLDDEERVSVRRRVRDLLAEAALTDVEHLLVSGDRRIRRRALVAATRAGLPPRTRFKLAAVVVAPATARTRLQMAQRVSRLALRHQDRVPPRDLG